MESCAYIGHNHRVVLRDYQLGLKHKTLLSETFNKEDGSLDIEWINKLPLEEHFQVVESLTEKQFKEYLSKKTINESANYPHKTYVDKPMEEWGVDAMEYLNKLKDSLK